MSSGVLLILSVSVFKNLDGGVWAVENLIQNPIENAWGQYESADTGPNLPTPKTFDRF